MYMNETQDLQLQRVVGGNPGGPGQFNIKPKIYIKQLDYDIQMNKQKNTHFKMKLGQRKWDVDGGW